MVGLGLLAVALMPGGAGFALLAAVPMTGLGALLLVASFELAASPRLFDCGRSCYPVIGVTAAATVIADPFWALVMGTVAEVGRKAVVQGLRRRAGS